MASKIEAPFTGTEVDPTDPAGSTMNVIYGIASVALALAVFAGGQRVYNMIAQNTPDAVEPVEVF